MNQGKVLSKCGVSLEGDAGIVGIKTRLSVSRRVAFPFVTNSDHSPKDGTGMTTKLAVILFSVVD